MKKITLVFITIISFLQQCMPRMPPGQSFLLFTQQYLQVSRQQAGRNTRIPGYVYKQINNKPYISAFIKAGMRYRRGQAKRFGRVHKAQRPGIYGQYRYRLKTFMHLRPYRALPI